MRTFIFALLIAIVKNTACQPLFQGVYGGRVFIGTESPTMAASPGGQYLWHRTPTGNELIKVGLDGTTLWSKDISFSGGPFTTGRIHYTDGALYMTGAYQNAGYRNFLAKLDTNGVQLWAREINYGDVNMNTRIHAQANGVLLVGHRDALEFGEFTFDITLARFAADGTLLWNKVHSFSGWSITALASATTPNGDLLVAGNAFAPLASSDLDLVLWRFSAAGDLLWRRDVVDPSNFLTDVRPTDMIATSDGHFALCATTYNTNSNYDAHVMKLDEAGTLLWAKRLYRIGWYESARSIMEDSQQRLVVSGWYGLWPDEGHLGVRLDLAGALIDATSLAGMGQEYPPSHYVASGRDIVERMGPYYVYSAHRNEGGGQVGHSLIGLAADGSTDCSGLLDVYPLLAADHTWTNTLSTVLPAVSSPVAVTAFSLTIGPGAGSGVDLCTLLDAPSAMPTAWAVRMDGSSGQLIVQPGVTHSGGAYIRISDGLGRICFARSIELHGSGPVRLDIGRLAPGHYVAAIQRPDGVQGYPFTIR